MSRITECVSTYDWATTTRKVDGYGLEIRRKIGFCDLSGKLEIRELKHTAKRPLHLQFVTFFVSFDWSRATRSTVALSSYPIHVMHSFSRSNRLVIKQNLQCILKDRYGHSYLLMAARQIIMSYEVKTLSTYLGNIKTKITCLVYDKKRIYRKENLSIRSYWELEQPFYQILFWN